MNDYPKLLSAIFSAICSKADPCLVAVEGWGMDPWARESGRTAPFEIPSSLLPAGTRVEALSGDEELPRDLHRMATRTGANGVFAVPPMSSFRDGLSREWRERYEGLPVAAILAEVLLEGPRLARRRRRPSLQEQESAQADLWDTPRTLPDPMAVPAEVDGVVLLLPQRLIGSMRSWEWRKEFYPNHSVMIIEHDHPGVAEALGIDLRPDVRFSTVVFQRGPGLVRFVKITRDALDDGMEKIAEDVTQLLRLPSGKSLYGYVCTGGFDARYPRFDYHSEEAGLLRQEIEVFGESVPLFAVARVLRGVLRFPPRVSPVGESEFLMIEGRNITGNGRVETAVVRSTRMHARVIDYLEWGDFCIRAVSRNNGRMVVGVFEGENGVMIASPMVLVVRPNPDLTPGQRKVLLEFLRSPLCFRLLKMQNEYPYFGETLRISSRELEDLPVPLADPELSSALEQLEAARVAFASWIEEIDREADAIAEEASARVARLRIVSAARLAKRRHLGPD